MSDAPPPPPDGLGIFEPPPAPPAPLVEVPAYGEIPERRVAHPGRRALAFIIDGVGTVLVTIVVVFGGLILGSMESLIAIFWVPVASALLATVLTATLGVTPGKWLAGLRVVHVVTGRVTGAWAILRSLVIVSPIFAAVAVLRLLELGSTPGSEYVDPFLGALILPLVFWVAMFVVVVATPQHRGLEDRAGRSVVVLR
ncbi:MAG: RDD family protein [Pseudolysinimonas sp.]|uniref:RDD family protein n=1 Tax=Pseudolysinimonas sp. TaxID=2680009 RepID=UPI003C70C598